MGLDLSITDKIKDFAMTYYPLERGTTPIPSPEEQKAKISKN